MNQLTQIADIINDSNDININNINGDVNSPYAINREKFVPNTPEALQALEMAEDKDLKDTQNYAFYLKVVNEIGISEAIRLMKVFKSNIREKAETRFPVRNKKGYIRYLYKTKKYRG